MIENKLYQNETFWCIKDVLVPLFGLVHKLLTSAHTNPVKKTITNVVTSFCFWSLYYISFYSVSFCVTIVENKSKWCQIIIIIDTYYNRFRVYTQENRGEKKYYFVILSKVYNFHLILHAITSIGIHMGEGDAYSEVQQISMLK